ncbi:MAG: hypothetical protein QM779_11415 [Propionicimonas sp.]|uniref:hypothetical protein n=1 Tax=Propionicimonas sp. TaxID=1955623 RepID=UPI003D1222B8
MATGRISQQWAFGGLGALGGVAWAAGLRAYMWQISGTPHVDWVGTFGAILLPGAVCGALLGVAEARRRSGVTRGLRWFALAPLAFAVAPLSIPGALWTFLTTGMGGGAVGVSLMAIGGGFALGRSGPAWSRMVTGVLALALFCGITATVPLIGGESLALTTPRGAWVAVLVATLLAVIALASSIPFRATKGG